MKFGQIDNMNRVDSLPINYELSQIGYGKMNFNFCKTHVLSLPEDQPFNLYSLKYTCIPAQSESDSYSTASIHSQERPSQLPCS